MLARGRTGGEEVTNFVKVLAKSRAAAMAYALASGSLAEGRLTEREREQIALAVAEINGSEYCLLAHSLVLARDTGRPPARIPRQQVCQRTRRRRDRGSPGPRGAAPGSGPVHDHGAGAAGGRGPDHRPAGRRRGLAYPLTVPAVTVNKVCLSGLDAIALASQLIRLGEYDVIVAELESMTRAPHLLIILLGRDSKRRSGRGAGLGGPGRADRRLRPPVSLRRPCASLW